MVKPDKSVVSIDAATLDSLPPELREAFSQIYTEQEQQKAKEHQEEEREYQTEQANTLLSYHPSINQSERGRVDGVDRLRAENPVGWVEVVPSPSFEQVSAEQFHDDIYPDLIDLEGVEDDYERWAITERNNQSIAEHEKALDEQVPTIHQFYHDLYDISGVIPYQWEEGKQPHILVNHRDREHPYQLYTDYWEFIEGVGKETSFIYMGEFWQPKEGKGFLVAKRNAMTTINGFCVDIDRVDDDKGQHFGADWVMETLLETFDKNPEVVPNYLMLSGTGIQLWYVFGERIPLLSAKPRNGYKASPRRDKYQDVLRLLYRWFNDNLPPNRFKVDVPCATISHAFRAPVSPSKLHYPTRLFVNGGRRRKMISPLDLSDFLGGKLKPFDLEDLNQENYERIKEERENRENGRDAPATEKQLAWLSKLQAMECVEVPEESLTIADADALIKQGEVVYTRRGQYRKSGGSITTTSGHHVARRPRDPKLYRFTLEKMKKETPTGSRYNALFGLAGLGWNCGIPKEQVERDMMEALDTKWAHKLSKDGKPLTRDDVKAAMHGYNKLGALRPREQLEFRLQWSYAPPATRNHQKRQVHLHADEWVIEGKRKVNLCKANRELALEEARANGRVGRPKGSGTKAQIIKTYAAEHPEANHSEIARALGMSRTTVIKWLKHQKKDA